MLTLQWSFPQVSWNFVLKSIYIDFFQLAIVKLYRMLDQAEVIIISESQMCMFIKRAAEVEIQKTVWYCSESYSYVWVTAFGNY